MPTIPPTMKAQVLTGYNEPYQYTDISTPTLTSGYDLLIKVEAASYCHTDAVCAAGGFAQHSNAPTQWPHIGCHEFAGVVVSLPDPKLHGPIPPDSPRYQIGDRIGVPGRAFHPCGSCFECRDQTTRFGQPGDRVGYSVYCPNAKNLGLSVRGGFAEYAVVDTRQVARLPDGLSAVQAAPLMCAGLTIYAALKNCELSPGERVAIIGCGGGLGHLGLQMAERMGLKVVGVDTSTEALDRARRMAPESRLVDGTKVSAGTVRREIGEEDGKSEAGQMGAVAAIILPESQAAFEYGMQLLKNRGRCVVVSFPTNGFSFSAQDVVFRQVSIVGSLVGSNALLREMLEFVRRHGIHSDVCLFPLSGLNDLTELHTKGGQGKLVIDMGL